MEETTTFEVLFNSSSNLLTEFSEFCIIPNKGQSEEET